MLRSSNLVKKPLAEVEPGELIRYNFSTGASLLLLLQKRDDGTGLFGVITSPEFEQPMSSYAMKLDDDCLSYGGDWFLQEVHGAETVVRGYYLEQNSHLVLDGEGIIFIFRPEKNQFGSRPVFFNASTNSIKPTLERHNTAPITEWGIWESEDRFSDGLPSLFEMKQRPANGSANTAAS